MATESTENPQLESAVQICAVALQKIAEYELDPALDQQLHKLGERKEFLSQAEHAELLALVDFVQKRTIEKLEAQGALARLRTALPGLFAGA